MIPRVLASSTSVMQTTKAALEARGGRWLNHRMKRDLFTWVPESPLGRELLAKPEQMLGAVSGQEINFYHVCATVLAFHGS